MNREPEYSLICEKTIRMTECLLASIFERGFRSDKRVGTNGDMRCLVNRGDLVKVNERCED